MQKSVQGKNSLHFLKSTLTSAFPFDSYTYSSFYPSSRKPKKQTLLQTKKQTLPKTSHLQPVFSYIHSNKLLGDKEAVNLKTFSYSTTPHTVILVPEGTEDFLMFRKRVMSYLNKLLANSPCTAFAILT